MTLKYDLRDPQNFEHWAVDNVDAQYANLCQIIRKHGTIENDPERTEETGWQTIINSSLLLTNTAIAYPVLLQKLVMYENANDEISWMFRGETNINTLRSGIWKLWADPDGDIGHGYGRMMRAVPDVKILQTGDTPQRRNLTAGDYGRNQKELDRAIKSDSYNVSEIEPNVWLIEGEIDQLLIALKQVMKHSRGRRIRVQTYVPQYLTMQNLPPCHTNFEFNVTKATQYEQQLMVLRGEEPREDTLHLTMSMRSSDVPTGKPFNTSAYAYIQHVFAKYAKLNIGSFCINSTNTHIYENQFEAVDKSLKGYEMMLADIARTGEAPRYPIMYIDDCIMDMTPKELLDNFTCDWGRLDGYKPYQGRIAAPLTK